MLSHLLRTYLLVQVAYQGHTIISIEGDGYEVYTDFGNFFNITWDDIVAEHIEPIGVFEWDGKYCMHPVMPIKERFTLQMGNMANVWARLAELGLLEE